MMWTHQVNELIERYAEGSGTPRGSKRSLLPELMGSEAKTDDPSAYPTQPGSPPKKSRLYKDPVSHSPLAPHHSSDPLGYSMDPLGHSSDLLGHSPAVSKYSPLTGQENSQHNSNASALPLEGFAHAGKGCEGFTHTDRGHLEHRVLPGAESIVSRAQQLSTGQPSHAGSAAMLYDTVMPQQQGFNTWDQAVFDAQWDGSVAGPGMYDSRAGQYAAPASTTGQNAAFAPIHFPEPTQQLQAASSSDGLAGLRFWEYPEYHAEAAAEPQTGAASRDRGGWLYNSQHRQGQQLQQQQQPVRPPRQNLVFGDFSPQDLQGMQLSQHQSSGATGNSGMHTEAAAANAQTVDNSAADSSNAAQPNDGNQSWWYSMLGNSNAEGDVQQAGAGSFDLTKHVAEWSDMLLPGVVFATDWTAQHDPQLQQGSVQGRGAPRDLLEQLRGNDKQKLA